MSNHDESLQQDRSDRSSAVSKKRRLVAFAVLLALTVAGGVAARMAGGAPGGPPDLGVHTSGSDGHVTLRGRLDRTSVMHGGDGLVKLELAITAADDGSLAEATRVPTDLIVVLDRSGSMRGAPIEHAKAAVRELIAGLGPDDRFALVTYASGVSTPIPLAHATPGHRSSWHATLNAVQASGGTNMSSGLDVATASLAGMRTPGRAPRVVLVSDGHANEGDSSRDGLLSRARRAVSGEYALSTVGVGEGFDESLMTALADAGTGNFYYVQRSVELGEIFAAEFASARSQVARALEVEIRPQPGVRVVSAAGYPLEHAGGRVVFRPGALFAGQERRVWVSFHVADDAEPQDGAVRPLGAVALHYVRSGSPRTVRLDDEPQVAMVVDEQQFLASVDRTAWAQSVVEEELGALKQTVSEALQRADTDAALGYMREFRTKKARLNAVVASPAVEGAMTSVAEMEADVARAAEAKDDAEQNRLSKKYNAEGYDGRRQGAKHSGK